MSPEPRSLTVDARHLCLRPRCLGKEILPKPPAQRLAMGLRQKFGRQTKLEKSGGIHRFVFAPKLLRSRHHAQLHTRKSIQAGRPQGFRHQRLRKEPAHSTLAPKLHRVSRSRNAALARIRARSPCSMRSTESHTPPCAGIRSQAGLQHGHVGGNQPAPLGAQPLDLIGGS